jgi:hypothetical protein
MKYHDDCERAFTHLSRAYYGKSCLKISEYADEVMFGYYGTDGGTTGEMSMRWHKLGTELVPRLGCFADAWHSLYTFQDVLKELSEVDDINITPDQFCAILLKCGFRDKTQTEPRR